MSEKWVDFNVNERIRVKLTDVGREELQRQADEFNAMFRNGPRFEIPKEDADGYSYWALWSLMQDLGALCRVGASLPFETAIQFSVPGEAKS